MLSPKNHSLSRSRRRVRCTAAVSLGYCEPSKPQSDVPGYSRDPGIYRLGRLFLLAVIRCYFVAGMDENPGFPWRKAGSGCSSREFISEISEANGPLANA